MDFVKKTYEQAVEFLQSLTPTARLTAAGLVAGIVVSLMLLGQFPSPSGEAYLFGARPFPDHELSKMEAALAEAGLQGWTREANRLRVPQQEKTRYLAALSAAGALPEQPGAAYDEVFQNNSLLDSRPVMDSKLRRASERSLGATICSLKGVDSATVKIEEIDHGGFPRRRELRAVATVRAAANRSLDRQQAVSIRDIVAHGGGVATEHVVVVDMNANRSFRGSQLDGPSPHAADDPYLARQRAYEQATRQRIEDVLVMYPGAIISVHAELVASALSHQSDYAWRPDSAEARAAGVATAPGSSGEDAPAQPAAWPAASFMPRATASILLPRSLFKQIWQQENGLPNSTSIREPDKRQVAEIEARVVRDVQDAVAPLLPVPPGEDPTRLVTVRAFTAARLPVDESPTVSRAALAWLSANWTTLGLFALAAFALWLVRSLARSMLVKPTPATRPVSQSGGVLHDPNGVPLAANAEGQEPDLRRELSALIQEDPERAASLMSEWLNEAA